MSEMKQSHKINKTWERIALGKALLSSDILP